MRSIETLKRKKDLKQNSTYTYHHDHPQYPHPHVHPTSSSNPHTGRTILLRQRGTRRTSIRHIRHGRAHPRISVRQLIRTLRRNLLSNHLRHELPIPTQRNHHLTRAIIHRDTPKIQPPPTTTTPTTRRIRPTHGFIFPTTNTHLNIRSILQQRLKEYFILQHLPRRHRLLALRDRIPRSQARLTCPRRRNPIPNHHPFLINHPLPTSILVFTHHIRKKLPPRIMHHPRRVVERRLPERKYS